MSYIISLGFIFLICEMEKPISCVIGRIKEMVYVGYTW